MGNMASEPRKDDDASGGAQTTDVVIAGASFAGLAMAAALLQQFDGALRLTIVDRAKDPATVPDDGRAFAIWAGSRAVLDALGAWPAIAPAAQAVSAIEISDSARDDAVRPARLCYDGVTSDNRTVAHVVPTHVLHGALYDCVRNHPAITWRMATSVEDVSGSTAGASVSLSDGTAIRCRLAIAADGRASVLRARAGIDTVDWGYAQTGIVTTVAFEDPHNGVAVQHFMPGGPFAILPLAKNRACITWSLAAAEADRVLALDDAGFADELDARMAGRFGPFTHVGPKRSWPLSLSLPRALFADRVVLIGDAAHGVHPIAGQGANLAFRDVAALSDVLRDAAMIGLDIGSAAVLQRYERWRRFDSTMSAGMYDGLNRLFAIDSTVVRAGRGAALGLLDRIPAIKTWIMDEAAGLNGKLPTLMRGAAV